jgi:Rrf2 family transcriptional regulator, nitric oxide-sensitive transcriptional repressor
VFSQTVEYALRAMVYLADQNAAPRTVEQIAEVTLVPTAYLSKVLQGLARGGLVKSQRGVHGGFLVSRPPAAITILEVVNSVDPIRRISVCPLGLAAHGAVLCPLHSRLDRALATVEEAFGSCSLADVLAEPSTSIPLCNGPRPAACPKK